MYFVFIDSFYEKKRFLKVYKNFLKILNNKLEKNVRCIESIYLVILG